MKKIAMIFLLAFFQAARVQAMDLFSGTLAIRDEQPLFQLCGLSRYELVLVNQEGSSAEYLTQMRKLGVDRGEKLQAEILGYLRRDGQTRFLLVESIEKVAPGSCQLDSQFPKNSGKMD